MVTVVGMRYQNFNHMSKLSIDEVLYLKTEPENKVNKRAVAVFQGNNYPIKIGYIKDEYLEEVHGWLKQGIDRVVVRKLSQYYILVTPSVLNVNKPYYEPDDDGLLDATRYALNAEGTKTGRTSARVQYNTTEKENKMFEANKVIDNNVKNATSAALLEAGRITNNQAVKVIAAKAPLMVKGYVETPIGKVVVANVAALAAQKLRPNDLRLRKLTDAMALMAYQELIQTFDIEGWIDEVVSSKTVQKALAAVEAEAKA